MPLSHPQTIPPLPLVCGKIVFQETGPWCQRLGILELDQLGTH